MRASCKIIKVSQNALTLMQWWVFVNFHNSAQSHFPLCLINWKYSWMEFKLSFCHTIFHVSFTNLVQSLKVFQHVTISHHSEGQWVESRDSSLEQFFFIYVLLVLTALCGKLREFSRKMQYFPRFSRRSAFAIWSTNFLKSTFWVSNR